MVMKSIAAVWNAILKINGWEPEMKYIGIVGSRRRNTEEDFQIVKKELLSIYVVGDIIVSGGCPKGGDC